MCPSLAGHLPLYDPVFALATISGHDFDADLKYGLQQNLHPERHGLQLTPSSVPSYFTLSYPIPCVCTFSAMKKKWKVAI